MNNSYCSYWTEAAVDCYKRGCVCQGCLIYEQIGKDCRMKASVLELVRKLGKPPERITKDLTHYEQDIVDVILDGYDSFENIAIQLNKSEGAIIGMLHRLYQKAREHGWCPKKKGLVTKCLLPQFIKWVRNGGFENDL